MTENETDTEQKIFEAACRIFEQKGFDGARMQEIADEADINKSMLHYYYRSKDKLFQKVYQKEMGRFLPVIFDLWNADLPLDKKIREVVEAYYAFLNENPRIAQFVIHEMNQNPERFQDFLAKLDLKVPQNFNRQIDREIKQENINEIDPRQLIISVVALTHFPVIARTMVKSINNFDDEAFQQFMEERKQFLVDFILNGINYQK
ncbi:MAG TPA: TetR/AcrR family transcriptional regulator [Balneolaceae bacterium]|nr:TetR/AcrR family transcriptional regulator [Balneolaceae bacterium]